MINIGLLYVDTKNLSMHEEHNKLKTASELINKLNKDLKSLITTKQDIIRWIILPSDKNYIEIWGDTSENMKLSKKLIKKLKIKYKTVIELN